MFLCYGQEEFFECRDEKHFSVPLNFSDMLEQRVKRTSHEEHTASVRRATLAARGGDNFSSKASKSGNFLGVDDGVGERLDDNIMDQSCFGVGETCIRESRMDDIASMYEATLNPDALMR